MATEEEIRPIYSELQGYLSQAPRSENTGLIGDKSFWLQYHQTIDELSKITGEDYSRYKVEIRSTQRGGGYMNVVPYRSKLGGLISRLHGQYFADKPAPFSGMPSTIVTQTAQQNQSVDVRVKMLLDIQSLLDKKINESEDGSKEKGFLEKLKGKLASVKENREVDV